jgi:hypothetical protein
MKKISLLSVLTIIILLSGCSKGGEVKTLYGSWEFVQSFNKESGQWQEGKENFWIIVEDKCEDIKIYTKVIDLLSDEIPMSDCKCFGDRDQISFRDTTQSSGYSERYELKMDATRDTLTGTVTVVYVPDSTEVIPDLVSRVKLARIQ